MSDDARLVELASCGEEEGFEERLSLLQLLSSLGASDAELDRAVNSQGSAGAIALRLALRQSAGAHEGSASGPARSSEQLKSTWRALGFPDLGQDAPLEPGLLDAIGLLGQMGEEFLGDEAALAIARVIGSSAQRLAQALVDAARVEFEMPLRASGVPYPEVVRGYVSVASESLPRLIDAFGAVLREHLLRQAAGSWSYDHEEAVARREVVVAFADLVGYTAVSRTLSGIELASMVEGFEAALFDSASRHGVQLVKLIGDGAMAVAEDADRACAFALDLVARIGRDSRLPSVRVALAGGSAVSFAGDFYGEVVNVAARLLLVAEPAGAVCDETVREGTHGSFAFERLPARPLKGLAEPPLAYRLLAA